MPKFTVFQIDSFTKEKFKGNPAGVVLNANGLSDNHMQQIARELNNSETAFVFQPTNESEYDVQIRYFTPRTEVPICGHATIAALYSLAVENELDTTTLMVKTNIGILPMEILHENGDWQVVMTQGKFELGLPFVEELSHRIIKALGISKESLAHNCPIQIASTGHSKVMIGIKSRSTLNGLTPDMRELASISSTIGCNGYFVFTFDSSIPHILTFGRMFAPAIGIDEDPVTGNANGPLGGYLIENKLVSYSGNVFEFVGAQGEAINRFGTMVVKVQVENHKPSLIKIKGNAVIVFKAEIEI